MIYNQNPIPWEKLVFSRYQPTKPKEVRNRSIRGFDTETLDGKVKLICDDEGTTLHVENLNSLLNFLNTKRYRRTHNFFFNLRYDITAIIKWLPEEELRILIKTNKCEILGYKLFYIPKKLFTISKSKHTCKYYDVAQFYEMSLLKAGKKYCKSQKEPGNLDVKLIGSSLEYWNNNYDDIVKYCIQDCVVCQELGILLHNTLINKIGIIPKSYVSKAAISKQYFRTFSKLPNIHKIPQEVSMFAYASYSGGWFEMIKKGYIGKKIYDADINSAYPDAIRNFPDINKGHWKEVNQVHQEAILGYYKVIVDIPDIKISPIPFNLTKTFKINPIGKFTTCLTKIEIDSYKKDIDIKILMGWEFYSDNPSYPFKEQIEKLYDLKTDEKINAKKEKRQKGFEYGLYKIIMNAFYGVTYEKNLVMPGEDDEGQYKTGIMFNPIMAAFITAYCRVMIWEAIRDKQDSVCMIATDGILFDIDPKMEDSEALGEWEVQEKEDAILLASGIYSTNTGVKQRGMQKTSGIITPEGKKYKNIFEYITNEPEREAYPVIIQKVIQVKEALCQKKYSHEDINLFKDVEKVININNDKKRIWTDTFENGRDMKLRFIRSSPIEIS